MEILEKFKHIQQIKQNLGPEQLCYYANPLTQKLLEFAKEAFSYSFTDSPNYSKLRFFLTKAMDCPVNHIYDWYPLLNNTWSKQLEISNESIDE